MTSVWTKIRIGLKIAVATFVVVYICTFIFQNGDSATVWFWINTRVQMWVPGLMFLSILAGAVAMLLGRMLWKTLRQLREMRQRARLERIEKQLADQQNSASKLQTRE